MKELSRIAACVVIFANLVNADEPKMVKYDRRIWLISNNDANIDARFINIRSIDANSMNATISKASRSDSLVFSGVISIHLTEWKADHAKETLSQIAIFDSRTDSLISSIQDTGSVSVSGNFLDKGDWVDKYYGAPIPLPYDSVTIVISTQTSGMFGFEKTFKFNTKYKVYPKEQPRPSDMPIYLRFIDGLLNLIS
ncbi:MAG TPA: hypothetical protein PKO15_17720 [Fibrobacteria bacterium]|nr:hypothetical protein [Fibrobacteria bacterium]